jgi:hypothetical protein
MPAPEPRGGSWAEYRRLVIQALDDLEERQKSLETGRQTNHDEIEKLRKDVSALRHVVFGDGHPDNALQVRLARIEDFIDRQPQIHKHPPQTDSGKIDKKMLVLLIGSISGLVALAAKLVDLIGDLFKKISGG